MPPKIELVETNDTALSGNLSGELLFAGASVGEALVQGLLQTERIPTALNGMGERAGRLPASRHFEAWMIFCVRLVAASLGFPFLSKRISLGVRDWP